MTLAIVQCHIDPETVTEVKRILEKRYGSYGMTIREAIEIFLCQVIERQGIPFPLVLPTSPDFGRFAGKKKLRGKNIRKTTRRT